MATITGTAGDDTRNGTALADTIDGGAGADRLLGGGGADVINGGDGNDTISGDAGGVTLINTNAAGVQGNGFAFQSAISPDGNKVAFVSNSTNLVAGDTNGLNDLFVQDLRTGVVTRVNTATDGSQVTVLANSFNSSFSPDGNRIVFESNATNLVPGDTNGQFDLFIKNLVTGQTTRVSTTSTGEQSIGGQAARGAFTADGNSVVFDSQATNLVAGDTNGVSDIFIKNLTTGAVTRVSTSSLGAEGTGGGAFTAAVSANGNVVAFQSSATNMVAGDTNAATDIFVKNLTTGALTRVSTATDGTQANGPSFQTTISADGTKVAFESLASNLVAGDTNGRSDIFIKDLVTGVTTMVSRSDAGVIGNGDSFFVRFSPDGNRLAFESNASNLVAGDTNGVTDVFIKDLVTGALTLASTTNGGGQSNNRSFRPSLADNGVVSFTGSGTNMVAGDANGTDDVFVIGGGAPGADTINGGAGNDLIGGGAGNDVIDGGDGDDFVGGEADNDRISGGAGNDRLFGDAGNDLIGGGAGADGLFGGDGDDFIGGEADNDFLDGGAGVDVLFGDAGGDTLAGGAGADRLFGGEGNDSLEGQDGDDYLDGGVGDDRLSGGEGADTLNGFAGNDLIGGGAGADTIDGGDGDDFVGGEADNDRISGGAGADRLFGDAGNDLIGGGDGEDGIFGGDGDDFAGGEAGDDFLDGGAGVDVLFGDAGNDRFLGGAGDDRLFGGEGNDVFTGQAGNDQIDGGAGTDMAVFTGLRSGYTITTTGALTTVTGADGTDRLLSVERLQFSDQVVSITTSAPNEVDVQAPNNHDFMEHTLVPPGLDLVL